MRLRLNHHRPLGTGLAALCSMVLVFAVGLSAQSGVQGQATSGTFAPAWDVTFKKIKDAMERKIGGVVVEQIRRVRHVDERTKAVSYPGTLEQLKYLPPASSQNSRFSLTFQGLEGQVLQPAQRAQRVAAFNRQAAFKFKYQSFRVADPVLAKKAYNLVFLSYGRRVIKEGVRIVYRMVALPKKWDRSAWLLELDMRTGYPLYSGQYSRLESGRRVLASELVITSLRAGMRFSKATKWWAPSLGVQHATTEMGALKQALRSSKSYVSPRQFVNADYHALRYEIHTDPYKGTKHALSIYSDGLDYFFVRQRNIPLVARGADDSVAYLDVDGITQCLFSHKGVEFLVVGRMDGLRVRTLSADIFSGAISTL